MSSTVFIKNCVPEQFNIKEILRYSGCKETTPETEALLQECLAEAGDSFSYKVCFCIVPLIFENGEVVFSNFRTKSEKLIKNLEGCTSAIVFGATVGIEIDRIIAKYSRISPSKAVMMQAIGAERIESLCDAFCKELKKEHPYIKPRFSPGYGDFALDYQKDIFSLLDCSRKIGLSLNESLLMSPSKSVTAIVGISESETECEIPCRLCDKKDCAYRSR